MIETAPDRLARLLALVTYLDENRDVPVQRVAEHFGISEAQVLEDVNTLWVSGTPGYMHGDLIDFSADHLDQGVLTLLDPRGMDRPLRLGPSEAVALLVSLQTLKAGLGDSDVLASTERKLREAAGAAADAADAIRVDLGEHEAGQRRRLLEDAITRGRRLHLRYVSASDTVTERDVDPLHLLTDGAHWFLTAWCHRAQDLRQFRLDRMLAVDVLDVAADPHPNVVAPERVEPETAEAPLVRLELESRARWVAEQYPVTSVKELPDGAFVVELGVVDPAWLHSLVMSLGPDVRSLAPADVAAGIARRAGAALAAYRDEGLED